MNPKKKLILVVDDEPDQAMLIAKALERTSQYTAITAGNGIEAFEKLRKHQTFWGFGDNKIKCILLDMHMPDMDGPEFLALLRKEERFKTFSRYMPVIIITAHDTQEYIEKATHSIDGMAAGYLFKPFKTEELLDLLDRILIHRDAEDLVKSTRGNRENLRKNPPA